MISKANLVEALEKRFDFTSARSMLRETLAKADMKEKENYGVREVATFLEALKTLEKRHEKVAAHLSTFGVDITAPAPSQPSEPAVTETVAAADVQATPEPAVADGGAGEATPPDGDAADAPSAEGDATEAPAEADDGDKKGKKPKKK